VLWAHDGELSSAHGFRQGLPETVVGLGGLALLCSRITLYLKQACEAALLTLRA